MIPTPVFEEPRFDIASARRGPHDVVLIAGNGYIGMCATAAALATVDSAVKRGMANKSHNMYVAVSDNVTAIAARLPGRPAGQLQGLGARQHRRRACGSGSEAA
ncbi:MAG: hypothetical protein ACXVH1_23095 [Solirubrobacteraceae bacterium]